MVTLAYLIGCVIFSLSIRNNEGMKMKITSLIGGIVGIMVWDGTDVVMHGLVAGVLAWIIAELSAEIYKCVR